MANIVEIITKLTDHAGKPIGELRKKIVNLGKSVETQTQKFKMSENGQKSLVQTTNTVKDVSAKYAAQQKKVADQTATLAAKNKFIGDTANKYGVTTSRVTQAMKMQGLQFDKSGKIVDMAGRKVQNLNKTMAKGIGKTRQFEMQWLGIMFLGMALTRLFGGIARATTTAFTKIMESNEMLGTAIQVLGVHWEYLKFTIGSAINTALERLLPVILPILSALTEWIQKHPTLTAGIIGFGLALGMVFLVLGQFFLGLNAVLGVLGKMGIVTTKIGPAILSFLGGPISLVIAVLLILILLIPKARKAFFKMFTWLGRMLSDLGGLFISVFKGDWELAALYGKNVLISLLGAVVSFVESVAQMLLFLNKYMMEAILSPLYLILKLIDKVAGTNFAGQAKGMFDAAYDFASKGISFLLDTGNLEEMRKKNLDEIEIIKKTREATGIAVKEQESKDKDMESVLDTRNMKEILDELSKPKLQVEDTQTTQPSLTKEDMEEIMAKNPAQVTNLTQNMYGVREEEIMNETKKYI